MDMKFYKCSHCGNIVAYVQDNGPKVVCCGEEMKEMVANTTDAATEKHVPVVTVDGNQVTVSVGSVTHPMEEKHYIQWDQPADRAGKSAQSFEARSGAHRHLRHGSRRQVRGRL